MSQVGGCVGATWRKRGGRGGTWRGGQGWREREHQARRERKRMTAALERQGCEGKRGEFGGPWVPSNGSH